MFFNNVLYFPYIRVPYSTWFTRILLYWDKVGAIIPQDYIENPELLGQYAMELAQAELVAQVIPGAYIWHVPNFADGFLSYLHSAGVDLEKRRKAFKNPDGEWHIHIEKIGSLEGQLVDLGLAKPLQYPWYYMETETAKDFMVYLAAVLGKLDDVQCTPITDDQEYLNHFIRASTPKGSSKNLLESLRYDVLEELFPAPAHALKASEIANFKHKYSNLLRDFRYHVEKELIEIANINDPELRNYRRALFSNDIQGRLAEIKARMGESGWMDLLLGKICSVAGVIPGAHWIFGLASVVYSAFKQAEQPIDSSPLLYASYAQQELLQT